MLHLWTWRCACTYLHLLLSIILFLRQDFSFKLKIWLDLLVCKFRDPQPVSYTYTFFMLGLQVHTTMSGFLHGKKLGTIIGICRYYRLLAVPSCPKTTFFIAHLTMNLSMNQPFKVGSQSRPLLILLLARNQSLNRWALWETFYIQTIIPSN